MGDLGDEWRVRDNKNRSITLEPDLWRDYILNATPSFTLKWHLNACCKRQPYISTRRDAEAGSACLYWHGHPERLQAVVCGFSLCWWVSFLDWVQVSCWPNQCQPNWLQWFINHGKAGRQVRVTAPIQISLDLTSVYGRYKSLKTLSIFYEWNEYFYAIMSCSAEVTYSYETPINFLKVGSTRTQQQAAFIVMISILEASMKPILEEALCVPIV